MMWRKQKIAVAFYLASSSENS